MRILTLEEVTTACFRKGSFPRTYYVPLNTRKTEVLELGNYLERIMSSTGRATVTMTLHKAQRGGQYRRLDVDVHQPNSVKEIPPISSDWADDY